MYEKKDQMKHKTRNLRILLYVVSKLHTRISWLYLSGYSLAHRRNHSGLPKPAVRTVVGNKAIF